MKEGWDLIQRPIRSVAIDQIEKQHAKKRMTVWERMRVLSDKEPIVLFQNWGQEPGRRLARHRHPEHRRARRGRHGHDFTVRAGSMDATNGSKLAKHFRLAGERGIPLHRHDRLGRRLRPGRRGRARRRRRGFTALRKISGAVPTIMCMFGFNAGGGLYLPRQGSFVIQPNDTFFVNPKSSTRWQTVS